ncbi:hypothetical protein [Celeribacter halophilus]|uniref:hypothetical protein n=1 Tax=Celeribacter halophilus TaxID=576117 RepID=UPI003A9455DC
MLNQDIVFRDTYRLLCIFMAEQAIFDITPEDQQVWGGSQSSEEPLFRLRHQFIEDEINHTLINLAICNRTHMEFKKEKHAREYPDHICGTLIRGVATGEDEPLTFREACNKIIHANTFLATFKIAEEVKNVTDEVAPIHHEIWLLGDKFGKKWKAELDVLGFLRATTENFDLF